MKAVLTILVLVCAGCSAPSRPQVYVSPPGGPITASDQYAFPIK